MIHRRKPIARSAAPVRRVAPRKRRSGKRRGPLREKGYRQWLQVNGKCRACRVMVNWASCGGLEMDPDGRLPDLRASCMAGLCDPCHTVNNGMSSKGPDSGCAPACRRHHDEYDGRRPLPNRERGKEAFEAFYGFSMQHEAEAHYLAYTLTGELP